jgi:hypothetical protein
MLIGDNSHWGSWITLPQRQSRSRRGRRDYEGGAWRRRPAGWQLEPAPQPVGDQGAHYDVKKSKGGMKSWGIVSASLAPHLAPGVRRCSAIALRLGRRLCSLGYHLQVESPTTTRLFSRRHQLSHVLQGGIAATPSLPLFPPS